MTPQAILSTWKDRSRPIGQKAVYYRLFSRQNFTFTSPASFSIGYGSATCFTFQAAFKRPLFFPAAASRSRSGKSPVKKTGLCVCPQRKNKNKLFGSFILKMAFENKKSFLSFSLWYNLSSFFNENKTSSNCISLVKKDTPASV